eukprot:TRINITY_DN2246_c0_g4_i3.p1 TRINITY_DN2246_c0_g4~~TRINITY_DN2246_c0_g4_i3.p1  ORF type:complete len:544 (+),score=195.40 TRINITY_DN2246_c0_g4_i3:759-2390(+)
MRAQAQHCAISKVSKYAPDKFSLLAQLAMQASDFYGRAHGLLSSPSMAAASPLRKFLPVVVFNGCANKAKANFLMAQQYVKEFKTSKVGIGKAVAYMTIACNILEEIKGDQATLPPGILSQYHELRNTYGKQRSYFEEANRSTFHEEVPSKVEKIECKAFTQALCLDEDLNRPFEGKEILSRMIPQMVQRLEDEYKECVEAIINQTFDFLAAADKEQEDFWIKYDLPACLYAASGEQKLPEDLLAKIQQCKEKGGTKLLRHTLETLVSSANSIEVQLNNMETQLQSEIEEDEQFRKKYGENCFPEKVRTLIIKMWNYIDNYRNKLKEGMEVDGILSKMLIDEGVKFEIIEIDKSEIIAMIPKSSCAERQLSFVATQLTNLIKNLEEVKKDCQKLAQEMMTTLETDNVNSELFQIYNKSKEKGVVFNEIAGKYNRIKSKIKELVIQRREILADIGKCMAEFVKEKTGQDEDPNRVMFFKQIDEECNNFNKCYEKLYRNSHYYTQLKDEVSKLSSIVNDFITTRINDKEKLSKTLRNKCGNTELA